MLGTVVDTGALLKTVGASVLGGLGITIVYSLTVYGMTRMADLRRDERSLAAAAAAALAGLTFLVCTAAMVLGILVMTSK